MTPERPGLVLASAMGFCVGAGTVATVGALYPPARDHLWPIASVAAASVALVLILYLIAARETGSSWDTRSRSSLRHRWQ